MLLREDHFSNGSFERRFAEGQVLPAGPLRAFAERNGLKVWLCHRHHNEPGYSAHFDAGLALALKAAAQKSYEEKNGPGAHAAWMAAVGKDYLDA